jgi:hypothetical protein
MTEDAVLAAVRKAVFSLEDHLPRFTAVLRILKLLQGAVAAQWHDRHARLNRMSIRWGEQRHETDARPGVRRFGRPKADTGAEGNLVRNVDLLPFVGLQIDRA